MGREENRDYEFEDRSDVGRRLAHRLASYRGSGAVVLALPRGGVEVGAELARELALPLDVVVVCRVPRPGHPGTSLGAVVEGLPPVLDEKKVAASGLTEGEVASLVRTEEREVERRVRRYRGGAYLADIRGRVVILVDDGIATGETVRPAIAALRQRRPRRLVLAVGICAPGPFQELAGAVDELVALSVPAGFGSIGDVYRRYDPVTDDRVTAALGRSREMFASEGGTPAG